MTTTDPIDRPDVVVIPAKTWTAWDREIDRANSLPDVSYDACQQCELPYPEPSESRYCPACQQLAQVQAVLDDECADCRTALDSTTGLCSGCDADTLPAAAVVSIAAARKARRS